MVIVMSLLIMSSPGTHYTVNSLVDTSTWSLAMWRNTPVGRDLLEQEKIVRSLLELASNFIVIIALASQRRS